MKVVAYVVLMDAPSDIIRLILDILPDCRNAARSCKNWYDAYTTTADYKVWVENNPAYVTPKMYPGVWRGTVFELARAENYGALELVLYDAIDFMDQRRSWNALYKMIGILIATGTPAAISLVEKIENKTIFSSCTHMIPHKAAKYNAEYALKLCNDRWTDVDATWGRAIAYSNMDLVRALHFGRDMSATALRSCKYLSDDMMEFVHKHRAVPDGVLADIVISRGKLCEMKKFVSLYGCLDMSPAAACTIYATGRFDTIEWLRSEKMLDPKIMNVGLHRIPFVITASSNQYQPVCLTLADRLLLAILMQMPCEDIIIGINPTCFRRFAPYVLLAAVARNCRGLIRWLIDNGVRRSVIRRQILLLDVDKDITGQVCLLSDVQLYKITREQKCRYCIGCNYSLDTDGKCLGLPRRSHYGARNSKHKNTHVYGCGCYYNKSCCDFGSIFSGTMPEFIDRFHNTDSESDDDGGDSGSDEGIEKSQKYSGAWVTPYPCGPLGLTSRELIEYGREFGAEEAMKICSDTSLVREMCMVIGRWDLVGKEEDVWEMDGV